MKKKAYFLQIHQLSVLGWVKVFRHYSNKEFFSSKEDALNKNGYNPEADLFSILHKLEDYRSSDGKFRFRLCYPREKYKDGKNCNEWIQSSNPALSDIIRDFQPIDLAWNKDGYGKPWRGLGKETVKGNDLTRISD